MSVQIYRLPGTNGKPDVHVLENELIRLDVSDKASQITFTDKRHSRNSSVLLENPPSLTLPIEQELYGECHVWMKPIEDEPPPADEESVELTVIRFFQSIGLSVEVDFILETQSPILTIRWRLMNRSQYPIFCDSQFQAKILGIHLDPNIKNYGKFASVHLDASESIVVFDRNLSCVAQQGNGFSHLAICPEVIPPLSYIIEAVHLTIFQSKISPIFANLFASLQKNGEEGFELITSKDGKFKILLQTKSGKAFDAQIEFQSGVPIHLNHASFDSPIIAIAIKTVSGDEIFKWIDEPFLPAKETNEALPERLRKFPTREDYASLSTQSTENLHYLEHHPMWRGWVAYELTRRAILDQEFEKAILYSEAQMLCNGDFPLAYWLKSVATRHAEQTDAMREDDNDSSLENLYYLAPNEVLLRAESFLRTPISMHPDPSPLVTKVATCPEWLTEPGRAYLELGLFADADRWLEEASRICPSAMIFLLKAYGLVQASNMKIQASEWIARAKLCEIQPQNIQRSIEITAMNKIAKEFDSPEYPFRDYIENLLKLIDNSSPF